jgi:hypothetical protein
MSPSVHQTSHRLLCEVLGGVLIEVVESAQVLVSIVESESAVGSVEVRAVAALYELLRDHPVDRRGRCRSCRRPGGVIGLRRRRCRVHRTAHFYLHHPDDAFFLSHLANEVDVPAPTLAGVGAQERTVGTAGSYGPEDTDVLPVLGTDPDDLPTDLQPPAVSPSAFLPGGFPGARQPVPDHGGAGVLIPAGLRSRRDQLDDPEPSGEGDRWMALAAASP